MFRLLFLVALLLPGAVHSQQTFQLNLPTPCSNCVIHADTLSISACDSYLSPSGNKIWIQSGFYQDTLYHSAICDTVVAVDLTITIIDTSIVRVDDTLIAQASGAFYQWINCQTGQPIPGAIGKTYLPTVTGDYGVIVTQNGCADTSGCFSIVIGIEESLHKQISVFPNPTTGSVTIKLAKALPLISAKVYDPEGRLVGQYTLDMMEHFTIPLPQTAGVYTLTLSTKEGLKAIFNIIRQ